MTTLRPAGQTLQHLREVIGSGRQLRYLIRDCDSISTKNLDV
jgi:hypothetical protein